VQVVGHDHISCYGVTSAPEHLKKIVHRAVAITQFDERQPLVAGKGDKVDAWFLYNHVHCHG
jgi:hypothetical protein